MLSLRSPASRGVRQATDHQTCHTTVFEKRRSAEEQGLNPATPERTVHQGKQREAGKRRPPYRNIPYHASGSERLVLANITSGGE